MGTIVSPRPFAATLASFVLAACASRTANLPAPTYRTPDLACVGCEKESTASPALPHEISYYAKRGRQLDSLLRGLPVGDGGERLSRPVRFAEDEVQLAQAERVTTPAERWFGADVKHKLEKAPLGVSVAVSMQPERGSHLVSAEKVGDEIAVGHPRVIARIRSMDKHQTKIFRPSSKSIDNAPYPRPDGTTTDNLKLDPNRTVYWIVDRVSDSEVRSHFVWIDLTNDRVEVLRTTGFMACAAKHLPKPDGPIARFASCEDAHLTTAEREALYAKPGPRDGKVRATDTEREYAAKPGWIACAQGCCSTRTAVHVAGSAASR